MTDPDPKQGCGLADAYAAIAEGKSEAEILEMFERKIDSNQGE